MATSIYIGNKPNEYNLCHSNRIVTMQPICYPSFKSNKPLFFVTDVCY
nr:MAG TPA: hypothetical protein [Caudoviricetes sp.]